MLDPRTPIHMSLPEIEFTVLRRTIALRGTTRMVLFPVTMLGWAVLAMVVLTFAEAPLASLFPLAVLVGGFEAIHALHVGAERIGRYLQVYYEDVENVEKGPRWETTVVAIGPGLPGGGIDPLFTFVFACAAFLNIVPALALVPGPTRTELGVIGVLHLLFVIRVVRARGAAARQRAVELESFRAVKQNSRNLKG